MPQLDLTHYRGNKNIPGIYQWIVNRIPTHDLMYEVFAGSAAITFHLPTVASTVVNDINPGVTDALNCKHRHNTIVTNVPAVQLLLSLHDHGKSTFVYCDPPYLFSTRGSQRRIYDFEMTDEEHLEFLSAVRTANFNCMISHYECELYNNELTTWNKEHRLVNYHGKVVEECIYYNYPKPTELQSYRYVGNDCWDRQRVTRKINRLTAKLAALPALERNAIISRLRDPIQLTTSVLEQKK